MGIVIWNNKDILTVKNTVRFYTLFLAALSFCAASPASAQESGEDQPLLSFGAGYYDILDDEGAADFRVEYRSGHEYFWNIKPWMGLEATSDGSIWGGAGILMDLDVGENFYVAPSFGIGLYTDGSSDLDLGYPIEFRSQIEGGYKFMSGQRLGVAFGHISNASLDEDNPGTEILNLYYHVPVGSLF